MIVFQIKVQLSRKIPQKKHWQKHKKQRNSYITHIACAGVYKTDICINLHKKIHDCDTHMASDHYKSVKATFRYSVLRIATLPTLKCTKLMYNMQYKNKKY